MDPARVIALLHPPWNSHWTAHRIRGVSPRAHRAPRVGAMGRLASEDGDDPELPWEGLDATQLHWWIEAMRRAFADRAVHLGDPDHHPVPVESLLSPEWIAERRVSIGARADLEVAAWAESPGDESSETTHLSVIDGAGNAVSLTTTLNGSFGSGIYVDEGGFLLNNEMDDFSIQPGTPNMYGLVGAAANQLGPRSVRCPPCVPWWSQSEGRCLPGARRAGRAEDHHRGDAGDPAGPGLWPVAVRRDPRPEASPAMASGGDALREGWDPRLLLELESHTGSRWWIRPRRSSGRFRPSTWLSMEPSRP